MHRAITVFVVLLFSLPTPQVQEHAPTLEVCRADVAIWGNLDTNGEYLKADTESQRNGTPNRTEIARLPIGEIRGRMKEMSQCRHVDPSRDDLYFQTASFYDGVRADRWWHFIVRHGLAAQFEQEDAEGKR